MNNINENVRSLKPYNQHLKYIASYAFVRELPSASHLMSFSLNLGNVPDSLQETALIVWAVVTNFTPPPGKQCVVEVGGKCQPLLCL